MKWRPNKEAYAMQKGFESQFCSMLLKNLKRQRTASKQLCPRMELKDLYTGVTRTRHVLVFIVQNMEQRTHAFQIGRNVGVVTFWLVECDSESAIEHHISRKVQVQGTASWN